MTQKIAEGYSRDGPKSTAQYYRGLVCQAWGWSRRAREGNLQSCAQGPFSLGDIRDRNSLSLMPLPIRLGDMVSNLRQERDKSRSPLGDRP